MSGGVQYGEHAYRVRSQAVIDQVRERGDERTANLWLDLRECPRVGEDGGEGISEGVGETLLQRG